MPESKPFENDNLRVAKLLLAFAEKPRFKNRLGEHGYVKVEDEELGFEEGIGNPALESLKALERREAIDFHNRDMFENDWGKEPYDVQPHPKQLRAFIAIATDPTFGLRLKDEREISDTYILLAKLLEEMGKKDKYGQDTTPAQLRQFKDRELLKLAEYLADYTGFVQFTRSVEAFPIYEDGSYRAEVENHPDDIGLYNRKAAENFLQVVEKRLDEQLYKLPWEDQPTRWYCKGCKRWLVTLDDKESVVDQLKRFMVRKYVRCSKCATKNFFTIDGTGFVTFQAVEKPKAKVKP